MKMVVAKAALIAAVYSFLQIGVAQEAQDKFVEPMASLHFDKDKSYFAVLHTTKGKIDCQLFPEKAPLTVTNFLQLAEGDFYNGLSFHLVIPGFVIQTGDPSGRGDGGPGYTLPSEIGLKHELGVLACARVPDAYNPNRRSSGSQFYITLDKISFLDGDYTVFGQVVEGFDIIKTITSEDKIDRVEILIK
jgi:cyclophilin family peptidyl-prolyl cis-trans isomerase